MKTFERQQILDAYDKIPDPIKDAIFAEATSEKIQAIGKKHGLLLDKMGALAEDIGYVMLGLISAKEFPDYVMQTCGVSAQKAGEIVTDLNQEIFLPIQDHIFSAVKEPKPAEKVAPLRAFDADPSPAFRPSSFAMPMQGGAEKQSKGQPSVAPMIFPQKLQEEESRPIASIPQNQSSIAPKAPEFREVVGDTKKSSAPAVHAASDVYREPIL
ncbi:MAG: hypothetical protein EXS68_02100 [Candidatus Ryanbacteria bacterium]|nr:hypothetical protein [Candidatus Ryanbacteria bacterium]